MELFRHNDIEKDFRGLRRFPTPQKSLETWESLFCLKGLKETPAINPFPGFETNKIYKARVVPLQENVGKTKGYRLIFEMLDVSRCRILAFSRHGIYKSEAELIKIIKARLKSSQNF